MKKCQNDKDEVPSILRYLYGEKSCFWLVKLSKTTQLIRYIQLYRTLVYIIIIQIISKYYNNTIIHKLIVTSNDWFYNFFPLNIVVYMEKILTRSKGLHPSQNGTFFKFLGD
jgi:hypothetical protein